MTGVTTRGILREKEREEKDIKGGTMREIFFRAKRKDKNEWVYGYYVYSSSGKHFIYRRKD